MGSGMNGSGGNGMDGSQQRSLTDGSGGGSGSSSRRNELRHGSSIIATSGSATGVASAARHPNGWRAGKPEEDPDKVKGWGFITARPSEYLIQMRGGAVRRAGQGASCFKFPWDSVAVVPTTVQRLQFVADQVTSEKVGVQITGLAVYRIAEPLIAFRMLNFSFPERAQEKLEELLIEMFVGAARRLVSNLTVEACLSKRKEGIAAELMREIAPVVAGSGRPEDTTSRGWGVVLDTIEIQDVRVLSDAVFANLQARYRNEQQQKAREAELARERAVRQTEAEAQRQIALTQLASESEIRQRKSETEERAQLEAFAAKARVEQARVAQERAQKAAQLELERAYAAAKLEAELDVKRRRTQAEEKARLEELGHRRTLAAAEAEVQREKVRREAEAELERIRLEAEAETARHAAALMRAEEEAARALAEAEVARARQQVAEAELAAFELGLRQQALAQELELGRTRTLREIENVISPEAVQLALAQRLPELAEAFGQKLGEVHVTSVDGANPFGYIVAAVEGVMGLARSAGLDLKGTRTPAT